MVLGVIIAIAVLLGAVYLSNRYHYAKGKMDGMSVEGVKWAEAYDAVRIPNWQTVEVGDEKQRKQQEAYLRLYVMMFATVKQAIGREMVMIRLDRLRQDSEELGFKADAIDVPKLQ